MTNSRWFLVTLLSFITFLPACGFLPSRDLISLSPYDSGQWKVVYRLSQPTTGLTLVRTPDDSRSRRWNITSSGFEIARSTTHDIVTRTDGEKFSSVEILVPATYVPLPKDYAPFSPFSDGGLLIHSGRFQACPTSVSQAIDDCDGPWSMKITAPKNSSILLNGRTYSHSAQWSDSDDGTNLYVGPASPHLSSHFVGIVDPGLPSEIADLLSMVLPELMDLFAQRLSPLRQRPMLFVSYDSNYDKGHGRQGGTLPDQIFMHFYGPGLENMTSNDNSPEEIAWFFAHESAHLFQRGVTGTRESSWIHEGAGEAFAYLMLAKLAMVSPEYLAVRKQRALEGCRNALDNAPLHHAAARGSFEDYYQCGLIMFLAIDTAIRDKSNDERDLFDFWKTLASDSRNNRPWDAREFLEEVELSSNPLLANKLRSLVFDKQDDPAATLDQLGVF